MSGAASKKIYYCAIARGVVILCEYTEQKGNNWRNFTQDILKKTKVGMHMVEYDACDYLIEREAGDVDTIYLIAVEKGFSKQVGFDMIDKMKSRFESMVQKEQVKAAKPFGLNPEFQEELKVLHVTRNR